MTKCIALIVAFIASTVFDADGESKLKEYGQKPYVRLSKDLPHVEDAP